MGSKRRLDLAATLVESMGDTGVDTLRTKVESGKISQTAMLRAILLLTEWIQANQQADTQGSAYVLKSVAELLQLGTSSPEGLG